MSQIARFDDPRLLQRSNNIMVVTILFIASPPEQILANDGADHRGSLGRQLRNLRKLYQVQHPSWKSTSLWRSLSPYLAPRRRPVHLCNALELFVGSPWPRAHNKLSAAKNLTHIAYWLSQYRQHLAAEGKENIPKQLLASGLWIRILTHHRWLIGISK